MKPTRILVVEDESIVALDIRDRLESLGYEVPATVASGEAAIDRAGALRPDLVLMDIQLQGHMDGVEAADQIRRRFGLPVIYLTANADHPTVARAKVTEPFGYVIKPFEERDLHTSIEIALYKHQAEGRLKESEERYRLLVELSPEAIIVQSDGCIVYANPAAATLVGAPDVEALVGRPVADFVDPDYRDNFNARENHLRENQESDLRAEKFVRLDGQTRDVEVVMAAVIYGGKAATQIQTRDITERRRAEEQLLHDAFHDSLTKLPNRALFIDHLKLAVNHCRRRKTYLFAVLFIDLDRFKVINDSLGHMVGDEVLIACARRLESCLREGDTIARLGGDEFTILLDGIKDHRDAHRVAERVQEVLSDPFVFAGRELFVTASVGIKYSGDNSQPEELLRDADTAMYSAKTLGKAQYQIFDTKMHTRAMTQLQIESDLRRAVDRAEFCVNYQPIVSLESGRITGFEALVRWQHPERGRIFPTEFISVAEETGLIMQIDLFVLRQACSQMRKWHDVLPITRRMKVSVNLSCKQFMQPMIVGQVLGILQETGLDPSSLKLEITESVMMEKGDHTMNVLEQFCQAGIELSLDDFGTGYSSLSYIHRFPVSTLKIDQSFIKRIGGDHNGEIVRAVVTLARNLGMEVVAEGIETAVQLDQLKALNCEQGQGYYFSTPVDAEVATELIQNDERGECLGYVGSGDDRETSSAVMTLTPALPDALM
ncbi:MAG TPA: EAL domain-containing protein [Pyrinomonadaceae bacterium]|jgi:diguanylate cyclase (GGDEF)-like protein/PAS domain S-box-containing protein|nr:EAL domain-containing protein [Pyrinomonadaceae bacterium]